MKGILSGTFFLFLTAAFLGCPSDSGPYELAVYLTGSGSVGLDPPGGVYESGSSVTLTATPAAGWHFDRWEGGATGSENPRTFTVQGNTAITAVFVADAPVYTLDVDAFGKGAVTLDPPGGSYAAGTSVTLTAEPSEPWVFSHWLGGATGATNPVTIDMTDDTSVTAVFQSASGLAMQLGYSQLNRMAASPDGRTVVTGGYDGVVRVWNTAAGVVERSIYENLNVPVSAAEFSPDGSEFLTAHLIGGADIWTTADAAPSLEKRRVLIPRRMGSVSTLVVRSAAFSPAGAHVLFGCADGTVLVADLEEGDLVAAYASHASGVAAVAYSSDAARIATAGYDNQARVYGVAFPAPIRTFTHPDEVWSVAFIAGGDKIVTGCRDGNVRICNVGTGAMSIIGAHAEGVLSIKASPDGTKVLTGSMDKTATLWDAVTLMPIYTLTGHQFGVPSVCFAQGGDRLFTADRETITQWDAATGTEITTLSGHTRSVFSAEFSPDGTMAATAGDYAARLYNAATGALLHAFHGHTDRVTSVSFAPDAAHVATGSLDGTVRIWSTDTGEPVLVIDAAGAVHAVDFSPDGANVVAGLQSNVAQIWNAFTGAPGVTFTGHTERVSTVAYSHDAALVATGSYDDTVKLWNAAAGAPALWTYVGFGNDVRAVAFSSDSSELLAGSFGGAFHAINTATGLQNWPVPPLAYGPCFDVAYSPDDTRILTAHSVFGHLWNIEEVAHEQEFIHVGQTRTVDYAPDGLRVLTGGEDGATRIWTLLDEAP